MELKVSWSISWVLIDQIGSYITRIIEFGHLGDDEICNPANRYSEKGEGIMKLRYSEGDRTSDESGLWLQSLKPCKVFWLAGWF